MNHMDLLKVLVQMQSHQKSIKDVPFKYNHVDSFLISTRTKNGSLQLTSDDFGLKVRAELLDTRTNQDTYKNGSIRTIRQNEFYLYIKKSKHGTNEGDILVRCISKTDRLYDVSIVDTPAYEKTSI